MATAPSVQSRLPLPAKAPKDETWLNPFGPLTTKAAKAAKPKISYAGQLALVATNGGFMPSVDGMAFATVTPAGVTLGRGRQLVSSALMQYAGLDVHVAADASFGFSIQVAKDLQTTEINCPTGERLPRNTALTLLESAFSSQGITVVREPGNVFKAFPTKDAVITPVDPKPYALLYTYSLIIALVCGTAGLPHILVRFYTNPDGVAAKRTTMWVMILIGIFYVFPPVFGVMGRNLMPSLYEGTGAKGTDKVVLELPRILNEGKVGGWESEKVGGSTNAASLSPAPSPTFPPAAGQPQAGSTAIPWGSILSGITCAGAFAAFMSTFSGLLVSMTGALAHDVYGRMLRPNSTPAERMRMFKFCAVAVGTVAVVLGSFVEPLQINFMVGQAFAIAAASYFPLLFMSVWWRGMTMRGAAAGMLTGGVCALAAVTLTNFSDLKWIALGDFWAAHPLLRILCEQPAIWTVPLAIGLMVAVSKLTRATVPADVRMKMLVLHAPEKLGLKQEYIKEHEAHGH
jgi:Na+(H+)/acetate symporter ActP